MRTLRTSTALFLAFGSQFQNLKPAYSSSPPADIAKFVGRQPTRPVGAGPASGAILRPKEYLFTAWSLGTLYPYAAPPRRAWLMYNAVSRQLVERAPYNRANRAVDMDLLREFVVGDSALHLRVTYRRYLNTRVAKPSLRTAFYEVHYDAGRTALLCQRTHNPSLPTSNTGGFTGRNDVLRYFIKNTDNQIIPVRLKSTEIIAALGPAHTDKLASYAQAQHLNFELERDIVQLLAYHDSLK